MAKEEISIQFFFWWHTRLGLQYFAIYHSPPTHLNTEEQKKEKQRQRKEAAKSIEIENRFVLTAFEFILNMMIVCNRHRCKWKVCIQLLTHFNCCSSSSVGAIEHSTIIRTQRNNSLLLTNIVQMLFPTSTPIAYIRVVPRATNIVSMFDARAHISQSEDSALHWVPVIYRMCPI